jgi:NADH-quinone oxidoreductase subunit K
MSVLTHQLLLFGATLFVLGMIGFLTRRSMILMFLSLEMMLAGVSINFIAFGQQHKNYQGQLMAIMILTVAACEAALALALVVTLFRRKNTLDVFSWSELNETPTTPFAETSEIILEKELDHPLLTPAGLDPSINPMPAALGDGWTKEDDKRFRTTEGTTRA